MHCTPTVSRVATSPNADTGLSKPRALGGGVVGLGRVGKGRALARGRCRRRRARGLRKRPQPVNPTPKGRALRQCACAAAPPGPRRVLCRRQTQSFWVVVRSRNHGNPRARARSHRSARFSLTVSTPAPTVQGHTAVVVVLLRYGADVNEVDELGYTPLLDAAMFSHPQAATLLLEHGANVLAASIGGVTALRIAETNIDQRAREQLGPDCVRTRLPYEIERWENAVETAAILEREERNRAKDVAFAMGVHKRLGSGSLVYTLHPELLRILLAFV